MIRDLCVAFVSIYLFTHAVDYWKSTENDYDRIFEKEPRRYVSKNKPKVSKNKTKSNISKADNYDCDNTSRINNIKSGNRLDEMVHIRALGFAEQSDLEESANAVTSYFGIPTKILSEIPTKEFMFFNDSLNGDVVLEHFVNNQTKTIYVSRYPLTDNDRQTLGGLTYPKAKAIIINAKSGIRHITIHEMGHTFGLRHCNNENCIMYYKYVKDVERLCSECNIKLKEKYPNLN